MTSSNACHLVEKQEVRLLRRRDWIGLPVLSLFTIAFIATSVELIARRVFPTAPADAQCGIVLDPLDGPRGVPNCIYHEKLPEGPFVEYRFNSCGHRASMDCGSKPVGTYRIVMMGTSVAEGDAVPLEMTFAALLPNELSQQTGRKVDLYNEGIGGGFTPRGVVVHFNEVLTANPDLIFWILTPTDVERSLPDTDPVNPIVNEDFRKRVWFRLENEFAAKSFPDAVSGLWQHGLNGFETTRTGILLQHFLYESRSLYVKSSIMRGDSAGYLKTEPSERWQRRLSRFDVYAEEVEARASASGVPVVAVLIPSRAQAAMISMGSWPAGFDPYKLDRALRHIFLSHGGIYIDILPDFRTIPNPEQYYLAVDGHPDSEANAILSRLLAKELTSGAVPTLSAARQPEVTLKKNR